MTDYQMGTVESRFADIIWENEPISSTELAHRSETAFAWKKSTTYTVLKRLCAKGLFENNSGVVTSRMSREQFYARQSEKFVEQAFHGSLPAFLAAFTNGRPLKQEEVESLRQMVAEYEEGK